MKIHSWSDYMCLTKLCLEQTDEFTVREIYKSCVAYAVSGLKHPTESFLNEYEIILLNARRLLSHNDIESAKQILCNINFKDHSTDSLLNYLFQGDHSFLEGTILHRQGRHLEASVKMYEAQKFYEKSFDSHRELRALINAKISETNELETYNNGEIYALQLYAEQNEFYDLCGNISRSRACEFLAQGYFREAIEEATESIHYLKKDGYPDDLSISWCIITISYYLLGEIEKAKLSSYKVNIKNGKVKSYWHIIESLSKGQTPVIQDHHPLFKTPWYKSSLKSSSVVGKIVTSLKAGAKTRDELIYELWGTQADDPSYCNRLYSALSHIRKTKGFTILYNGSKYELVE